jgi:hypothetical protein
LCLSLALVLAACGGHRGSGVDLPLVSGLQISQVSLYQGLKSAVMQDGAPATSTVPVVAGKAGMLRVFVQPGDGWSPKMVKARLELTQAGGALPAVEMTQLVSGASAEGDLGTTLNFSLGAMTISNDLTFAVTLYDTVNGPSGDTSGARYPASGQVAMGATTTGIVKVNLVPIAYGADGSNRMPSTAQPDLDAFRARMMKIYPVSDVQITVAAPYNWSSQVSGNGTGWDELLNAMVEKRISDGAAPDVYYYGLFVPSSSFDHYCQLGCVLGLSPLAADPMDDTARASIGVQFKTGIADPDQTFVHEVGHAHGRLHAPCMTQDPDRHFPYQNGGIGVWGYDPDAQALVDPNGTARDMMGYCDPPWISDYTYKALYDRVRLINGVQPYRLETESRWQSLIVRDGEVVRGHVSTFRNPPMGVDKIVQRDGAAPLTARYYPFDHLPGGILFVPEDVDLGSLHIDGLPVQ